MPNDVSLLFFSALLHEDIGILTAAFVVTEQRLSFGAALAILYLGVITNNCTVYGLGAAARRLPGLRRWLIGERVEHMRTRLQRRLLITLAAGRFIPGVLSPTLLGCGWLGIPLPRFLAAAALAAALYVPLIFTLAVVLGETVLRNAAGNVWLILPLLLLVAAALGGRKLLRMRSKR